MESTYLAPSVSYTCPVTNQTIELEKGQQYDIEVESDGPVMIINGQQAIHPDSTFWVTVNNVRIPYAPNLIQNFWSL